MIRWGANSWGYDDLNRLTSGNGFDYLYDGDNNRYAMTGGPANLVYLVDDRNPSGYPQVLEEFTQLSSGNVVLTRAYNYGLALISQQQFDTNTLLPSVLSYYGYDGHGSVRFLMDTNGTITDTYTYDAFGTLLTQPGPTPNNYLYCGQQWDPAIGLYYNRNRYNLTDVGRFTSIDGDYGNNEDPLSLHKYLYAEDDPVNGSDPSGNEDIGEPVATAYLASFGRFGGIRSVGVMPGSAVPLTISPWGSVIIGFYGADAFGDAHGANPELARIASIVHAPIFRSLDFLEAYESLLKFFSDPANADVPIKIFGHSWGATSAIKLTRWLDQTPIRNHIIDLYTMDPVSILRTRPISVPSCVSFFWNRYETSGGRVFGPFKFHGRKWPTHAGRSNQELLTDAMYPGINHVQIVFDLEHDLIQNHLEAPPEE